MGLHLFDFGIMGTLTDVDKNYLRRTFAFFRRDYRQGAGHLGGWVPKDTGGRIRECHSRGVRAYLCQVARELLRRVLVRLFQTSRRFNVEIQPQRFCCRGPLNIEGLGRPRPRLDLWKTAKPYLERWMSSAGLASTRNLRNEVLLGRDVAPTPAAAPSTPVPMTPRHWPNAAVTTQQKRLMGWLIALSVCSSRSSQRNLFIS
jgi:ubiquinone biosynthesis protein